MSGPSRLGFRDRQKQGVKHNLHVCDPPNNNVLTWRNDNMITHGDIPENLSRCTTQAL